MHRSNKKRNEILQDAEEYIFQAMTKLTVPSAIMRTDDSICIPTFIQSKGYFHLKFKIITRCTYRHLSLNLFFIYT